MTYLTEKYLGEILPILFPDEEIIHNRKVPNSDCNFRPDYRIESKKLIIEFNGYNHYNNSKTIFRDKTKFSLYKIMGYRVIEIPYFIQLTPKVIRFLFGKSCEEFYDYPHGFTSKEALLPSDFNPLGVERFDSDLDRFYFIKSDILKSLQEQVVHGTPFYLYFPKTSKYYEEFTSLFH